LDYTVSEGGDTLVTANEIKSFTNTNGQDLNRDENTLVAFDLRKAAIDAANKRIEVANIVAKASWDASILLKDGIEGIACQKQDFPSNKTFRVLPSWHNYCNSVVNDVAVNKILQQHFQLCRDEELGAGTYVQTNMTGNYYGHPAGVNPYTSIIWDDANYGTCLSGDKIGQFFIDYIDIGKQVEPTATSNDYDWHLTDLKVGNDLLYSTSTHLHRLRFQFKKHYNAAYNFPNANPNVVVD
jgi:hypothetical protein